MIINYDINNPVVLGDKPVLLDFYAEWCGPCKMLGKVLDEYSDKHSELLIVKVDVDECEEFVDGYGVTNLPTLIYYEPQEIKWRHVGSLTLKQLEDLLDA